MPSAIRPISAAVTSPRHSRRPWRISLNNSLPAPATAPTVALRAEIMPLSGAKTWVCLRRSNCASNWALAESTRALATCSCVRYWLTCWALKAPLPCTARARSALAAASAAVAWASARAARAKATSACTLSAAKVASNCPFCTLSPTAACSSAIRNPLDSAPTLASCQAATPPLAASFRGAVLRLACTSDTVSAALGAGLGASAARLGVASPPRRARPVTTEGRLKGKAKERFMVCTLVLKKEKGEKKLWPLRALGLSGFKAPAQCAVQGHPGQLALQLQRAPGRLRGPGGAACLLQL